ncbi:MAG: deoxyribodipyrimidine photo-lyase [Desulfurococcaceae archaeon]
MLYTRSIYWFKRDLRVHDNRALAKTYEASDELAGVYVLDKKLVGDLSSNSLYLSFLINALGSLKGEVNVSLFRGDVGEVFDDILSRYKVGAIYTAVPLSWTEKSMADSVRAVCSRHGVKYCEILDNVLSTAFYMHPLTNFTAYYMSWLKSVDASMIPAVPRKKFLGIGGLELSEVASRLGAKPLDLEHTRVEWGRTRLSSFKFDKYGELRDYPYIDGVSRLSHFINQGVLSVREVYSKAARCSQEYTRQLAWREYYLALWRNYPWINELELKEYMRGFEWEDNKYYIECFKEGKTGYPIIDAGIRQLMREGWIHNRVRLIAANFLVKDLHVNWRAGAAFFKERLLDYDEVLNAGNWQWAASAGVDPLPIRLFNPIKQAKKYDPMCLYIKKYIPELEGVDCRALQDPLSYRVEGYYEPIVDHHEAAKKFSEYVKKRIAELRAKKL